MKIDFINSWKPGNKKEKYYLECRLGTFTLLELKFCIACEESCTSRRFRLIVCNFGFEI